jgi:hypothetical protein
MPNPSTTQVVGFIEQISLGDDAGGADRDRIWALALFWDEVQYPWAEIWLDANQI